MMVNQVDDTNQELCYGVGNWDPETTPTYNSDENSWSFVYQGDNDCGNPSRLWQPKFICDTSVDGFTGDTVQESGNCVFSVNIQTKYACVDGCSGGGGGGGGGGDDGGSTQELDGLSGGWIFIICFVSAFFVYCVGGYLFMGLSVNKDKGLGAFSENIPNKSFWVICPKLVFAGTQVTMEYCKGLMNRNKGDDTELDELMME